MIVCSNNVHPGYEPSTQITISGPPAGVISSQDIA
jgi:hypothetical protein